MSIRKLKDYSLESPIMVILIKYGEEKFVFNLGKEVEIREGLEQEELLKQPSAYSFLTTLHKNLIKEQSLAKVVEKKAYARAYLKYKDQTNNLTSRPNSDDTAKAKAELNKDYLAAQADLISLNYEVQIIEAAVRAFEQRKEILQTLSANQRKER